MDPFTENILSRARERQKLLKDYSNDDTTHQESHQSQRSPRKQKSPNESFYVSNSEDIPNKSMKINTLNILKENLNMEIRVTSSDDVRVEVEIDEEGDDTKTSAFLRKDAKEQLNRLGKLYAGGEDANLSSPIHRSEEKFHIEKESAKKLNSPKKPAGKGLRGLANLAHEINHWEDEIKPQNKTDEPLLSKSRFNKGPAPKPPHQAHHPPRPSMVPGSPIADRINRLNNITKEESDKIRNEENSNDNKTKALKWDRTILDNLESQGFRKNPVDAKLEYDYKENKISSPTRKMVTKPAIADKAARFETTQINKTVDPSSLSISERKALFEKNQGDALLPKAPFGVAIPVNVELKMTHKPVKEKSSLMRNSPKKYTAPEPPTKQENIGKQQEGQLYQSSQKTKSKFQANNIANTVAALFANRNTISQVQIEKDIKEQRHKEMDQLLNRFNKNKPEPNKNVIEDQDESSEEHGESPSHHRRSGSKRPSDSPKVSAVLEDYKRIKVSPPKPGRLYPNLSDIEATTETENEDASTQSPSSNNSSIESDYRGGDDMNTSFGREIMKVVNQNQTPIKRVIEGDSTASDLSDVLDDMDDYLDEALAYNEQVKIVGPTPPKLTRTEDRSSQPSNSFNYRSYTPKKLPTHVVEGDEVVPLTHTVSFYRKQTTNTPSNSPAKQIVRSTIEEDTEKENREDILGKIKTLQDEVNKQQLIIAQTSQALNLCNNTLEFMGSTEQVEAEKVLLLATHRRQAMLNEIQRLKVEGTSRPQNDHAENLPLEKGTLTVSNIRLPLKKEYVRALAAAGGKGHHVTCLLKCGEEVTCTKLASTVATDMKNPNYELNIPGSVTLKNIFSDFAVTFEVYCLQAQEEMLPHDVKYHIKKSSKATPKKSKHDLLSRPVKESPAGPQAVRSPSFALMGYIVFSIHQMNKTIWSLNNTPSMSPLEGNVEMNVKCELSTSVTHRGFLTMFEDISGFGAWHRRWCLLKGDTLSYWKYPDDEKKMPSIDTIDLRKCITKDVGPVSRDICARLHTFLFETVRDAQAQDKNTLVVNCKGDKTIIKHLLSADTKEERLQWCSKFNSVLKALKLWGNAARIEK